jgi:SAM-dependent methyltransferase
MTSLHLGKRLALLRERVAAPPRLPAGRAVREATLVRASSSSSSANADPPPKKRSSRKSSTPKSPAAEKPDPEQPPPSSSSTRRRRRPSAAAAAAAAANAAQAVDAATSLLFHSLIAPICGEAHCFEGASALRLQGAQDVPIGVAAVSVQHDHLPALEAAAAAAAVVAPLPAAAVVAPLPAEFAFPGRKGLALCRDGGLTAVVYADAGTVLRADPRRVAVDTLTTTTTPPTRCFARSLLAMARGDQTNASLAAAAEARLREQQRETSARNIAAWACSSSSAYDAWVQRFGPPATHAASIAADPGARVGRSLLRALLPPLEAAAASGRTARAANLMGSHGAKALALALLPPPLRAEVLVVDGSAENARYGREMAVEARKLVGHPVSVEYVVADVLDEEALFAEGAFDAVFFELGCLHYFLDPLPLFRVAARLLKRNKTSRLVVRDFHPVSAKLLDAPAATAAPRHDEAARAAQRVQARRAARKGLLAGGRRRGDYFSEALVETAVAFSKHHGSGGDDGQAAPVVLLRQHTLGDVVTAAVRAGLAIEYLEEEAGMRVEEDAGVPKLFTLVCTLQ